ncbi:formate dehydrogenase subunit delta [Shinella sp.]|uniref:formate dehydrogenase subunit delta n=1 Tax=Shinella sp. TaxID=1870904 RepID=UPI00301B6E49
MSDGNKIIRMANQIAIFFHSQPASEGPDGIATHINKFWEPRMRRQLFDLVDNHGGEGLDGLVLQAIPLIHRPAPQADAPAGLAGTAPAAP